MSVTVDETWRQHAACRSVPTAVFFGQGDPHDGDDDIAKAVCAGCPVKIDCKIDGMDEAYGVWGDTTPPERGFQTNTGKNPSRGGEKQMACREALLELFRDHPQRKLTYPQAHRALPDADRWSVHMVRRELPQLTKAGLLKRVRLSSTGESNRPAYVYQWNPEGGA